jgi:hydrogenase maturation protease
MKKRAADKFGSGAGRSAEGECRGSKDISTEHDPDGFLNEMARSRVQQINVGGKLLRPGSRVRLKPRPCGDIVDMALAGRIAVVEAIDEDDAGAAHVAVTLDDFSGWDLGAAKHPAHRFFFDPSELEPVGAEEELVPQRRVLVAGIGNIFFGDDGFGVEVANRLLGRWLPPGIEVADFGIRGMDLAYALGRAYHAAILVDAVPLGKAPGTIYVIEPEVYQGKVSGVDPHRMDPLTVLGLARRLGRVPEHLLIVGCEPGAIDDGEDSDQISMTLSAPVAAAVDEAVEMITEMASRLLEENKEVRRKK